MNSTETLEISTFSFDIPSSRLGDVKARIDVLNRKCVKLSIAPITIETAREIVKQVGTHHEADAFQREHTTYEDVLFTPCTIAFVPVKVVGSYRFVASIEHDVIADKNHNVVAGYNLSEEMEKSYRHVASNCGHCNTMRRRNKTFILTNLDNGSSIQVGSTCISSFFPMNVESAVLSIDIASEIASMGDEESFGGGSRSSNLIRLDKLVSYTVAQVRQFGFMSASKAKEQSEFGNFTTSTASYVLMQIYPHPKMKQEDRLVVSEEDEKIAQEIIGKWELELVPLLDTNSDALDQFQYKIACATSLGYVKQSLVNTVIGSVGYSLRKIQEQKSPKVVCDEFLPGVEVKSKIEIELTVARLHKIDGQYGTTTILSFKDKDGRNCVWFASGSLDEKEWVVGSTVKVKGTVKDMKVDAKYGKQTILTRVKKI